MDVRKTHPYDGSAKAGAPIGGALQVVRTYQHNPVDGPGTGIICELSDNSWEFLHNLKVGKIK